LDKFRGERGTFAEVRFMSKKISVENIVGTGSAVSRAFPVYMGGRTTEHAAREASGIRANKLCDGVGRVSGVGDRGCALVTTHGLLGWRHVGAGKGRDVVGGGGGIYSDG
jgi:hypothetical protein